MYMLHRPSGLWIGKVGIEKKLTTSKSVINHQESVTTHSILVFQLCGKPIQWHIRISKLFKIIKIIIALAAFEQNIYTTYLFSDVKAVVWKSTHVEVWYGHSSYPMYQVYIVFPIWKDIRDKDSGLGYLTDLPPPLCLDALMIKLIVSQAADLGLRARYS